MSFNTSPVTSNFSSLFFNNSYVQGTLAVSAITLIALAVLKYGKKQTNIKDLFVSNGAVIDHNPLIKRVNTRDGELQLVREGNDLQWVLAKPISGGILSFTKYKQYKGPALSDIVVLETYAKDISKKGRDLVLQQAKDLRYVLFTKRDATFNAAGWIRDNIPLNLRISFFKDSEFDALECYEDGNISVRTKLRQFKSIYGQVEIDRDNWAITVLARVNAERAYEEMDPVQFLGHSVLVYEGVENGKQFFRSADVRKQAGSSYAEVRHFINPQLDAKQNVVQSQTWRRTSLQVTKMVDAILSDIELQNKNNPHEYSLTGGRTPPEILIFLVKAVGSMISLCDRPAVKINCHTWIVATLRYADIENLDLISTLGSAPVIVTPFLKM